MAVNAFRSHVQQLMILYGEIWSTHAVDRLGEIFSEDIQYIEKPACVMDGMCSLQEYWRVKVQQEKSVKYEALIEEFDVCEEQSWAWVKFRASFKISKKPTANQWVARITVNADGLISVFEEYWSRIGHQAVGMEQACTDWDKELTSIRTYVKATITAWRPALQKGGAESKTVLPARNRLAQLTELDDMINSIRCYMSEEKITADAMFVDPQHIELHHFVARLACVDANSKRLPDLFHHIDSDSDGVISAEEFRKAIATAYVCLRRTSISDSLGLSGTFKNLGFVQVGGIVEAVGKPVQDSSTGTVRLRCKMPGVSEGFVTITGNRGTAFFRSSSPSCDFLAEMCRLVQPALQRLCELAQNIHSELAKIFELGDPYFLSMTHAKLLKLLSAAQSLFEELRTLETNPLAELDAVLGGQDHEDKSQLIPNEEMPGTKNMASESPRLAEPDVNVIDETDTDRELQFPANKSVSGPCPDRSSPKSSSPKETVPDTYIGTLSSLGAKAKAKAYDASKPNRSGSDADRQSQSKATYSCLPTERSAQPHQAGRAKGEQEEPLNDGAGDTHGLMSVRPNSGYDPYQPNQHYQSSQPCWGTAAYSPFYQSLQPLWGTAYSHFYGALSMPGAFPVGLSGSHPRRDATSFRSSVRSRHKSKRRRRPSQRRKQRSVESSQSASRSTSSMPKAKRRKRRKGSVQQRRSSSSASSCTVLSKHRHTRSRRTSQRKKRIFGECSHSSSGASASSTPEAQGKKKRKDSLLGHRLLSGTSSCANLISESSNSTGSDIPDDNAEDDYDDHHEDHEKHNGQEKDTSSSSSGVTPRRTVSKELSIESKLSPTMLMVLE